MSKISLKQIKPNCVYVELEDRSRLFSYESPILEIKDNHITKVYDDYNYGTTTSKHINQFIDQYGFLVLGETNIYPLDNRKRKKLLDEFHKNQFKPL